MPLEPKDYFTSLVSGAALVWSIITYFVTKASNRESKELARRADEHAVQANKRLSAESEVSVQRLINEARLRIHELNVKCFDIEAGRAERDIPAAEKRHLANMRAAYAEAIEILLNSYELACGMYLDDKLDKERFKRQYYEEIRKLMNDAGGEYQRRLHGSTTPYRAINKVYVEWVNLEKDKS